MSPSACKTSRTRRNRKRGGLQNKLYSTIYSFPQPQSIKTTHKTSPPKQTHQKISIMKIHSKKKKWAAFAYVGKTLGDADAKLFTRHTILTANVER